MNGTRLVLGGDLDDATRREVLAAFVHRWSRDNPHLLAVYGRCPHCGPEVGRVPYRRECNQYHPTTPLVGDGEWLAARAFHVCADGTLDGRHRYCEPACLVLPGPFVALGAD